MLTWVPLTMALMMIMMTLGFCSDVCLYGLDDSFLIHGDIVARIIIYQP